MPKIYKRQNSKYWAAAIYQWQHSSNTMVRKRVSTRTESESEAIAFAVALESAAKTARSLAGKSIPKEHAAALLTSLLLTAGISIDDDDPSPDLLEFLQEFMDWRRDKVSLGSMKAYTGSHRKLLAWLTEIGEVSPTVSWVTRQRAEDYYRWLNQSLSLESSHAHIKWLSRVMKRAVDKTSLEKNPVEGIERDRKGTTLNRLPFSLVEAKQLISYLSDAGPRNREWARLVALSLMSGSRLEDTIKIDQKDIKNGVLTYRQGKTGKDISCPLVEPRWVAMISESNSGPVSPELHRFYESRGRVNHLSGEFTKLVSEAGVSQEFTIFKNGRKGARKTFHSLRHTLRTAIVASGGSDAQADTVLGHSPGEGKRYTHPEVDAMRSTLARALNID